MGLGDITVNSYLDQPFNAEIELIDVGNTLLSGIKASLASAEDFDRVGLERVYALNLLTFNVEKNVNGKAVIKVASIERISEPYMQLLVDLAWADGQIYRSYPILLDPPNYKLGQVKKQLQTIVKRQYESQLSSNQPGVVNKVVYGQVERESLDTAIDKRGVATYGPTVANETVWQIAQRYKTENILLQQMILAIVGTNPQAFTDGNLNGLKEGAYLRVPANKTASKVPVTLAKLEVLAHDKSWQSRRPLEHALLPPYIASTAPKAINEQEITPLGYPLSLSIIPPPPEILKLASADAPSFSRLLPLASSLLSLGEEGAPKRKTQDENKSAAAPVNIKVDKEVSAAAMGSVRQINVLLSEQLRSLQKDNKHLQQQLTKREQELSRLRKQIHSIVEQQRRAGEKRAATEQDSAWFWILLLVGLGASVSFIYWWWMKSRMRKTTAPVASTGPLLVEPSFVENKPVIDEPAEMVSNEPHVPSVILRQHKDNESSLEDRPVTKDVLQEIQVDDHCLEFEPKQVIAETPVGKVVPELTTKSKQAEEKDNEHSIDFILNPVEPLRAAAIQPMKSKAALDTLLALAKTYIDMDDIESAKQSLQEVIDFGSEKQKIEATRLLEMLDTK